MNIENATKIITQALQEVVTTEQGITVVILVGNTISIAQNVEGSTVLCGTEVENKALTDSE
jgi:hypothetical protein